MLLDFDFRNLDLVDEEDKSHFEEVEANEIKLALMRGVKDIESNVFWVISKTSVPCSSVVHPEVAIDMADLVQIGVEAVREKLFEAWLIELLKTDLLICEDDNVLEEILLRHGGKPDGIGLGVDSSET